MLLIRSQSSPTPELSLSPLMRYPGQPAHNHKSEKAAEWLMRAHDPAIAHRQVLSGMHTKQMLAASTCAAMLRGSFL